jgi:hypothetical protein
MTHAERSILVGRDVIRGILSTGDHARFFLGSYEPIAASYIEPWPVYDNLDLDRFVGRDWLVTGFDHFLATHESGYFVLETDAGLGKTAFLAWLARQRGYVHHFVELAPPGQEGVVVGLRNLAAQLIRAWRLDTDLVEASPLTSALRPQFLPNILREAVRARDSLRPGQRIVVVVDGLEGADRLPGQNNLNLPRRLPNGVYVLASQRPADVALRVDAARHIFRLEAQDDLNLRDMRLFLERVAERSAVERPETFIDALLERSQGVWIYLSFVIGELERGQRTFDAIEELPFGLWQYYAQYWMRWRDEHAADWETAHLPLLATLGAAAESLPFEMLCRLAGATSPPPRRLLDEHWRPFLTAGRGRDRRYNLYHDSIREFLHGRADLDQVTAAELSFTAELEDATEQAHGRIAHRYLEAWGGLGAGLPALRDPDLAAIDDSYGLRHLTRHLVEVDAEDLHRLLAMDWSDEATAHRPRWRSRNAWHAAAEGAGDSARYLEDIARAWRSAEDASSSEIERGALVSGMGRELRYALITASIRSIAENLPAPLLKALVDKGAWTALQGLAYARQIPSPQRRVEALAGVVGGLAEPERSRAVREALAVARTITDGPTRAEALAAVAPCLSGALGEDALAAAWDIQDWPSRVQALAALTSAIIDGRRVELLEALVAAVRAIRDETARAAVLPTLAALVPESLLGDTLAIADDLEDRFLRVSALSTVAHRLQEPARTEVVSRTLATARSIEDESERSAALAGLASFLPDTLLGDVLAGVWAIEPESRRTNVLAALAPFLPGPLVAKAVVVAEAMADERFRSEALKALGPRLPELLVAEAIASAEMIEQQRWRVQALTVLRPLLRGSARIKMLEAALAEARAIGDERLRAETIAGLAPILPGPLLAEAQRIACAIESRPWRSEALAALAPHLPRPLLDEALDAACAIGDKAAQVQTQLELGQHLPAQLQREILMTAAGVLNEHLRAEQLGALAPQLSEPLLAEALAAARTLVDEGARAEALTALSPYLPEQQVVEAYSEATLIGEEGPRAMAVAALGRRLPEWLLAEALDASRALSDHGARFQALIAVIPRLARRLRTEALQAALDAIRGTAEDVRPESLAALAPYLPDALADEALSIAQAIDSERWRARALAALAGYLPERLLGVALHSAQSQKDESWAVVALEALVPSLPDLLLAEALAAARPASDDSLGRARVLAVLAPYLSGQLLDDALTAATRMEFGPWRASTLAALAPYLSVPLLTQALGAARTIADEESRAEALAALAPYLPDALVPEALDSLLSVGDEFSRTRALTPLLPSLHEPTKTGMLEQAIEAIRAIPSDTRRAIALALLAPTLPEPHLAPALEAAVEVGDERRRAEAIAALAPHLSGDLLAEALAGARTISQERWLTQVLSALAPHLPAPLLQQVLDAVDSFSEERWRAQVLVAVAPRLDGLLLASAFASARTISQERWLTQALKALAPHLPEPLLAEALQAAAELSDENDRAMVLAAVAYPLAGSPPGVAWSALRTTLPILATRQRQDLLADLRSLRPLIHGVGGPNATREVFQAVVDVGRWWP